MMKNKSPKEPFPFKKNHKIQPLAILKMRKLRPRVVEGLT